MKFKFNLEKVLQHRKIKEDLAKKGFMEAANAVALEERKLDHMKRDLRLAREESHNWQNIGGTEGVRLQFIEEYIVGQTERIEHQISEVERSRVRLEEKRKVLVEAGREFKALDKLKERRQEEFTKTKNKLEQKRMDETSSMTRGRRKRA